MNTQELKTKVKAKYGARAAKLDYLGKQGANLVFGIIDKSIVKTIEEPFYITISEAGEITELFMPVIEDDLNLTSSFETLEQTYGYYTAAHIFD